MSDLNDLIPTNDTIDVVLKHPKTGEVLTNDNDGSNMTITVYASHTRQYKAVVYKLANERLKQKQDGIENLDFEELEQASIELFAGVTKGWNITFNGEKPKFSTKKAKELYEKIFWIKPQVEEALANSADFTKV